MKWHINENELSQEKVWSDLELSQKLSKEKTNLQKIISKLASG